MHLPSHPANGLKADVLNVALFGMTAKEWREEHPEEKGNIRNYANINQLICLSNFPPHSNKEKKVFHFKEIILLAAKLNGYGHAKITVGKQSLGKHLVYCLTGLEIEKTPIESTPLTGPRQ